jgi:predicted O-methyltransferase YrrM
MNRIGHKLSLVAQHPSLLFYALSHPDIDSLLYRYWILEKIWMPKLLKEINQIKVGGLSWKEFSHDILSKAVPDTESRYKEGSYYAALALSIRWLNPTTCVESGVSLGFSSWAILANLTQENARLVSIDLPRELYEEKSYGHAEEFRPREQVGKVVPEDLRKQWTLKFGDAKALLPDTLANISTLDFFLHDSEHSYEHMKFEFDQAYPKLRRGGLLVADDVNGNSAYQEFCEKNGIDYMIFEKTANKSEFGIGVRQT